jgi:hypothetical protein
MFEAVAAGKIAGSSQAENKGGISHAVYITFPEACLRGVIVTDQPRRNKHVKFAESF